MNHFSLAGSARAIVAIAAFASLSIGSSACTDPQDEGDLPPIAIAILDNDAARFENLLERGVPVDASMEVTSDDLIAHGVEVEGGRRVTFTPLLLASYVGAAPMVRALLARGADPNLANTDGASSLLVAVGAGHMDVVEMLIAAGADVDHRSPNGEAPLLVAIAENNLEIVDLLLAGGADPHRENPEGRSPMRLALARSNADLMALLQRYGVPLDPRDPILDDAIIDTIGHDPRAERLPIMRGPRPLGIAIDAAAGFVYWSENDRGRIRRTSVSGGAIETVVADAGDAPIGLAFETRSQRLYWTGDGSYPRFVRRADILTGILQTIAIGPVMNRPRAIAATPQFVFWTEIVNGRLRRAVPSGGAVLDLFTDGISSRADRNDYFPFFSLGLAVEPPGRLYWSDFYGQAIETAQADGSGRRRLYGRESGIEFPAGVALHVAEANLVWADVAREAIVRAPLAGGDPVVIVDDRAGLIGPRAVAIDALRNQIYWTDPARAALGRARLDGRDVEWLDLGAGDAASFSRMVPPIDCADVVRQRANVFLRHAEKRLELCLEKIDAVKSVKRRQDDARSAADTCIGQLSTLAPGRGHARGGLLREELPEACRDAPIEINDVLAGCGVGPVECESLDCSWAACRTTAWTEVGLRHLRTLEWIEEVRPFIVAQLALAQGDREAAVLALAVLDEVYRTVNGQHRPRRGGGGGVPATGMETSYRAVRAGATEQREVADDASIGAGTPMHFVDHGDGTLTDMATGLMWEKKCEGCGGLHDMRDGYVWSGDGSQTTIWDWIAELNRESGVGFAGFRDWRIPNVKELQSIVDYERFNPAVGRAFDGDRCGMGCSDLSDPTCSCTALGAYWSSTTLADQPDLGWSVSFNLGLVGDRPKNLFAGVRAVRGGRREGP